MDSLIVFVAQYLVFIMAAGFAVFWLVQEHWPTGKIHLGAVAAVGLLLTLAFIWIGGKLHSDPRPFVQNPALHPMFAHAKDNGFPSDHSAAAGLIAALVWWRSRRWGPVFAVAALLVAAARVASRVHHLQDVVAGLLFGVAAFVIAYYALRPVWHRLRGQVRLPLVGEFDLAELGQPAAEPFPRHVRGALAQPVTLDSQPRRSAAHSGAAAGRRGTGRHS